MHFQCWKLLPEVEEHTFTFAGTGVRMEETAINRRTYVLFLGHNPSVGKIFHMEGAGSPGRSFHNWKELEIWKSFPYMEAVARPLTVQRAVFQFLPAMPIFEFGNHFHMNCQKIPIIQNLRNYQFLGVAANFQNCLTIQKIQNSFNCQTILNLFPIYNLAWKELELSDNSH